MREIKFRSWVKAPSGNTWMNESPIFHGEINEIFTGEGSLGEIIYMQYTGLRDKNGVDIYEGDIIKKINAFWSDGLLGQTIFKDGSFKLVVSHSWATSSYYFTESDTHEDMGGSADLKNTYEVIGNIYENPSLLYK